jgi:PAS domain S-box-containing protein
MTAASDKRILNVNDDEATRYVLSRMLRRAGYQVLEAATGRAGVELAETQAPEMVLLDVKLPDISGFDVCQRLRANPKTAGILVLHTSATFVTPDKRVEGLQRGADAYLAQPFEPEELLATVNALFRQRSSGNGHVEASCGWHATFDAIGSAIAYLGKDGAIRSTNRVMAAMLGAPPNELVGRSFEEVAAEAFGRREIAPIRALCRSRCALTRELAIDERFYQVATDPMLRADGEFVGVVLTFADVTDRKRLFLELEKRSEALAQADVRKDEFLAMLAHELRNPLAAVTTAIHLLDLEPPRSDTEVRLRTTLARQTKHLTRLVDDLLDVARVTRGKVTLQSDRVDLRKIVQQALAATEHAFVARHQLVVVVLGEGEFPVTGDATRLEQVVANLLSNAAKYTEPGGRIDVQLSRQPESHGGERAVLRVKDSGIGIAPEMLTQIFDVFVQVDQSLARGQGGLGIGLTVVRKLIELHGGTVHAMSEGVGKGAEFAVSLPLLATPASDARAGTGHASSTTIPRGLRVLVIEDNIDGAEMVAALLAKWGCVVETAHDGRSGLERALRMKPDIALVDIGLPALDGYSIAERLKGAQETKRTFRIAMTGYGRGEDRARALDVGFHEHLVKPLDMTKLRNILTQYAEQHTDRDAEPRAEPHASHGG